MRHAVAAVLFFAGMAVHTPGLAETGDESRAQQGKKREAYPGMTNLVDEAVQNLAQKRNEEGLLKLKQKAYTGALELLKQAYDLNPKDAEITNNLGYIYYLLGNAEEAEKLLRASIALDPQRYVAYLNLADLLGREGESKQRLSEAAALLKKAREIHGYRQKVILRQARVERLRGMVDESLRFYEEYASLRKPSDKVLVEIGDYLRELGREEEAFEWYQKVDDSDEWGEEAAGRIWEMEVERQAERYGWTGRTDDVPEKAQSLATKARGLINHGKMGEARRLLEKALTIAPGFASARASLGDVFRKIGETGDAELSYLQALAMDNDNAEIYLRLGELYLDAAGRSRAAEAVVYLSRAVELRPDWRAVHLTLARALRGAGEMENALKHINMFLDGQPAGDKRQEAIRLKRTIEKLWGGEEKRGAEGDANVGDSRQALSRELVSALTSARAHLAKGRLDAAMAELRRVPADRQGTLVLNLEARILYASGRLKEASEALTSSLKLDATQKDVQEQLGVILMELGKKARARSYFLKAEALGNTAAAYHLAKLESAATSTAFLQWLVDLVSIRTLMRSRDRLSTFLADNQNAVYVEEAKALNASLDTRMWTVFATLLGLGVGMALIAVFMTRRLWGGSDLNTLITRHADAGTEVQRVLSAIRHEVLKHNTLALGGVVESIERGGMDAAEKARRFQRNLMGGEGDESVKERLDKYAIELGKIGRSHGLRLNLKRKEPAISLLYQGFGLLDEVSATLGKLPVLSVVGKSRLLGTLKKAFRLLNVDGYEAVQQMLGRIRFLEVDESVLRGIAVRVLREPAFSKVDAAPLAIDAHIEWPLAILVSRRAFEDIFVNLVRNAVQTSVEVGLTPVEIGFTVDLEVDAVTGLERAVFMVNDRSNKELTTEMIRSQAIEGGLGITADLVSRCDGSVDVVPGDRGWSKAVRVRLPVSWEREVTK